MQIYLVGGAVRDQLLGQTVTERDWVVVGATPEMLLKEGYQQVGRDFPVFLHPKTHEEYALARTERKTGRGYRGFICDANPAVTLEEDLARRDLTINAMAMDKKGNLIDPYHGQKDLQNKILRHVSNAFIEDPVRVLRLARFAARYAYLGFTLADETRQMVYEMVKHQELQSLIPERVWQEWQKSLTEKNPEVFLTTLRTCGALAEILPEIDALFGVPNKAKYHPEVDSGIHTLMAIAAATKLSSNPLVRFAAIVHDLGKAVTPMTQWPSHIGHENQGLKVIKTLCHRLRIPVEFREFSLLCCQYHLHIHRIYELRAKTIVSVLEACDAFRRPLRFELLLQVCEADKQGTLGTKDFSVAHDWQYLRDECAKITPKDFVAKGYSGESIKLALRHDRIERVKDLKKTLRTQ